MASLLPMEGRGRKTIVAALMAGALLASFGASPAGAGDSPRAHSSVTGGRPASLAQWGFTVAVLDRGRLACSGAVISPTRVLTAAHCIRGNPSQLSIVANRTVLGNTATGEVIGVTAAAVHPDFPLIQKHDLAVLTLAQETTAPPIALPSPGEPGGSPVAGATVQIAGFGSRNPIARGKQRVGVLMATSVRVRRSCSRYGPLFSLAAMICALGKPIDHLVLNRSACFGDSGGPMVANTPLGPRLVGVSSYVVSVTKGRFRGALCGFQKLPAVWARVADGLGFIQDNLADQ